MRIGLYGIGLDTYWPQFKGLYDRLTGYQARIADRVKTLHPGIEVINTGIIDSPVRARETGERLAREGVDLILLYVSTYALSSTLLPVVQRAKVAGIGRSRARIANDGFDLQIAKRGRKPGVPHFVAVDIARGIGGKPAQALVHVGKGHGRGLCAKPAHDAPPVDRSISLIEPSQCPSSATDMIVVLRNDGVTTKISSGSARMRMIDPPISRR